MTDSKHTPGPWRYQAYPDLFIVYGSDHVQVVKTSWHSSIREAYPLKPEAEANARLIAAAPDMLAALERIASGESDNAAKDASRAIAKAMNEGDGTHPNQMGPWS